MISVTKNGKPFHDYNWCEETRTFSSNADGLTIDCGYDCTINCGDYCTIDCGSDCTLTCDSYCTINCGDDCTITAKEECVVVRRGSVFEVIQPEAGQTLRLNGAGKKGYTVLPETKTITIDGKDISISPESFEALKKQLAEGE